MGTGSGEDLGSEIDTPKISDGDGDAEEGEYYRDLMAGEEDEDNYDADNYSIHDMEINVGVEDMFQLSKRERLRVNEEKLAEQNKKNQLKFPATVTTAQSIDVNDEVTAIVFEVTFPVGSTDGLCLLPISMSYFKNTDMEGSSVGTGSTHTGGSGRSNELNINKNINVSRNSSLSSIKSKKGSNLSISNINKLSHNNLILNNNNGNNNNFNNNYSSSNSFKNSNTYREENEETRVSEEKFIDCCLVTSSSSMKNFSKDILPGDVLMSIDDDLLFSYRVSSTILLSYFNGFSTFFND